MNKITPWQSTQNWECLCSKLAKGDQKHVLIGLFPLETAHIYFNKEKLFMFLELRKKKGGKGFGHNLWCKGQAKSHR